MLHVCVRSGQTIAESMLNAYYSKGCDSSELFSQYESYDKHLNKHNVIWIGMAGLYTRLNNKNTFVEKVKEFIYLDLKNNFKNLNLECDLTDGTFFS